jgi:hypothetical protein
MDTVFWDIAGPITLILLGISLISSVYFFLKKRPMFIIICVIITGAVSYIASWSIGLYVLVLAIIQLLAAVYLFVKKTKVKDFSLK